MKKIVIVNNNLKVGGVQKSLCNLIWEIKDEYDITLVLFKKIGAYMQDLPDNIHVIECNSLFKYLGISQAECIGKPIQYTLRFFLAALAKLFGRPAALKIILMSQPKLSEEYDCAISFLHNGRIRQLYGGVNEFVLNKTTAKKKIAFLHCDYRNCGANNDQNNCLLKCFDVIAACSDGCRHAFLELLPEFNNKCYTIENFNRYDEIRKLGEADSIVYPDNMLNIVTVSRLGGEKGIDRGIRAVAYALKNGMKICYHIVGDGRKLSELKRLTIELGITDKVRFYGEQSNPYPYMAAADLFLLTSYHEAAPMVVDEARCLGVPVLSVETTSSYDMITMKNSGWVCKNNQESLNDTLLWLLQNPNIIKEKSSQMKHIVCDNMAIKQQLAKMIS